MLTCVEKCPPLGGSDAREPDADRRATRMIPGRPYILVEQRGEANAVLTAATDCWNTANAAEVRGCFSASLYRVEAQLQGRVSEAHRLFTTAAKSDERKLRRAWLKTAASELLKAQKSWLRYRDSHCASVDGAVTGNEHGFAEARCKVDLTIERIREIDGYSGGG